MIDSAEPSNSVLGTTELTLKIGDLKSVDRFVEQVLFDKKELVDKLCTIDIETRDEDEEEEETKAETQPTDAIFEKADKLPTEHNKNDKDKNKPINSNPTNEKRLAARKAKEEEGARLAARLCGPLYQLLAAILARRGRLQHFSWRASYYSGTSFTRPSTFWAALFAHAPTLETLRLDFFEHEVPHVPSPKSPFPALKKLALDTASAHGDDGTSIDTLLQLCPNLETLEFIWPGCDLLTCQIQNITWIYTFPSLTRLDLRGHAFAPEALTAFLARHPGVKTLVDGIEYPTETIPALAPTALPNLKALHHTNGPLEAVVRYFDPQAQRSIHHLALRASRWDGRALGELSRMPSVKTQVKLLELYGDVPEWRDEDDDDSSDSEPEDAGKAPDPLPPRMPAVLQGCLAEFTSLRELGVSLESDGVLYTRPDGVFGTPDAATAEDVKHLLSHIPPTSQIRALRLWDSKAEPLAQAFLDDFPAVPDSLEYFAWYGRERGLYKLEKEEGKVRAVQCAEVRREEGSAGDEDWIEQRILDYGDSS